MKPVVVFVATFLVATAASTGAKVMMTPVPPVKAVDSAAVDSTAVDSTRKGADSTHTDTAIVDSGQPAPAPADTTRPTANMRVDSLKPKPLPLPVPPVQPAAKVVNAAAAASAANAAKPAAPANDTSERRLAKVFTSMDAKQAAKVLEHMSDNDVQVILGYVGVKQAASIMAALPPERVATLSKLEIQEKRK